MTAQPAILPEFSAPPAPRASRAGAPRESDDFSAAMREAEEAAAPAEKPAKKADRPADPPQEPAPERRADKSADAPAETPADTASAAPASPASAGTAANTARAAGAQQAAASAQPAAPATPATSPAAPAQSATPASPATPGTPPTPVQGQPAVDAAAKPSLPVETQGTPRTAARANPTQPAAPAPQASGTKQAPPATPARPGTAQAAAQPAAPTTPATPPAPAQANRTQQAAPVPVLAAATKTAGDGGEASPRLDAPRAERVVTMGAAPAGKSALGHAAARAAPQAHDPLKTALARLGITAQQAQQIQPAPQARGDGVPDPAMLMTSTSQVDAAAMRALPAQSVVQPSAPAIPVGAIAMQVAAQARAGLSRFQIRLDPPELGRVDVRLDVGHDGTVQTRMVVERAETLDLLQRDARALERALNSAGLKADDGSLSFSLKGERFGGEQQAGGSGPQADEATTGTDIGAEAAAMQAVYALQASSRGGVDIRV